MSTVRHGGSSIPGMTKRHNTPVACTAFVKPCETSHGSASRPTAAARQRQSPHRLIAQPPRISPKPMAAIGQVGPEGALLFRGNNQVSRNKAPTNRSAKPTNKSRIATRRFIVCTAA